MTDLVTNLANLIFGAVSLMLEVFLAPVITVFGPFFPMS